MAMVFVQAGKFTMGSDSYDDEKPIHKVTLHAYWIDQTEVTNALYAKCVDAGVCQPVICDPTVHREVFTARSSYRFQL
jgi:formylglycine-generating enzyme required for sulfatase activity